MIRILLFVLPVAVVFLPGPAIAPATEPERGEVDS